MKKDYAFWDYDVSKMDLKDPVVLRFYLSRKINCGDYSNIRKKDLQTNFEYLDIDDSMKNIFRRYFKKYGEKK